MPESFENLETRETLLEKIKSLEAEVERLKELAYKDELTGAYTRRALKDLSSAKLDEIKSNRDFIGKRKNESKDLGVIFFDIDHFKSINDNFGHDAGDEVLKEVVRRIQDNLRPGDILGRWGGEEFVVIIEDNEEDTEFVAQKLRKALDSKKLNYKEEEIKITGSFGVASLNNQDNIETMIDQADRAMYEAKKAGRNMVAKYSDIN